MTLDLFSYTQKIDIIVSARLENQNRLKQLFFDSVDNQRDENMKDLIRYGVDLNETNKNGETALCLAACSEKVKLIKCLVELGDNINATNKNGLKVLWAYLIKIRSYILFRKPWAIEPLRCLIAYGADVHVTHLNEDVPGNGVALFDYVAINRMGFDIAMDPEYLAPISEIIKEILPAIFLEDSSEHNPYYQRALQKQEEEPLPNLDLLTLWKSYQSELEALEKWMVCSTRVKDISLAKVVRASNHDKLVELAWAKGLMKEVLDPKFQEAFPVFGWMVRAKLEAAFAQTESITKAEAPLFRLIQKNRPTKALPLEMCREILSYLPISDLENVKHV